MEWFIRHGRLVAVVAFAALLLAGLKLSGLTENFSLEALRQVILANRISGLLLFVLLFSLGNLIQVPGWLFLAAAVLALGRGLGGGVTYVAACVSCMATFLSIRLVGGDALRQFDNRIAVGLLRRLDDRPVACMVLLRVLFQTAPALNYALAMSGIRFRNYMVGTLLGLPLPIMLYCLFFDYLGRVL